MAVPLPDDTALDMVSFALSGPALIAGSAFTAFGLAFLFSFAEVGPREQPVNTYFLRIDIPTTRVVELPNGTARQLRAGENVLLLGSKEECLGLGKRMEGEEVSYSVYEASGGNMKLLGQFPRDVNAVGGAWSAMMGEVEEKEGRWAEYAQLGEIGDVENEWRKVVDQLGGVRVEATRDCRLCGGSGYRRCHKCGGASGRGGEYVCDCQEGRRRCEWCAGV